MEIVQLDGGQLVITGTAGELTAVQELLAAAADAASDFDAQETIWKYQEQLEE